MGCTIVFVILLVIGMGILCFLTGDMTAFIALAATLVIGLGLAGILYRFYRSRQRRKRGNPLSPTLRWMNAAGSILIAANRRTNFYRMAGFRYRQEMEVLSRRYQNMTEVQLIEEARKANPNANEDSYLPKMLMAWRRYGENALLGWDVGRCAYVTQCCYLAGYINMQEMLDLCVDAGTKNFSELGGNDGELSAGWSVLAARGPKQSKIYDGQALEAL